MHKTLHLLITGGTIDSVFDPASDSTVVTDTSVIGNYLEKIIKPRFKLTQEIITMKDSRQITDNTRADIVSAIVGCKTPYVLVTHGTYTMPQTVEYLHAKRDQFEKTTVICTGSFFPLRNFAESDATFNLGFAIGSIFLAKPGVYLAMNGKLFEPGAVYKNLELGRFEER